MRQDKQSPSEISRVDWGVEARQSGRPTTRVQPIPNPREDLKSPEGGTTPAFQTRLIHGDPTTASHRIIGLAQDRGLDSAKRRFDPVARTADLSAIESRRQPTAL